MCEFCNMYLSARGTQFGKTIGLEKTVSGTDMKDCQIIIHKEQKPALMIFDKFGRGAFIEISNCPMCGRGLEEVAKEK